MIRKALEFFGDCCFIVYLFAQYVLGYIARLVWCIALIPLVAHAGGYCNSCYHQTYVQHEYVPQTIIEHQNNEIFYQVPNAVQQYAVTPGAIAQAKLGELERQAAATRDRIAEYQQLIQQQQPQQVVYLPVQAAAYCAPGQQPEMQPNPQMPPQQQQPAQQPTRFSERAPQSIIQAACLKCHGGASVKGDLDFTKSLTCEQKQKALVKVAAGEMPKGGPKFSPEQFMQIAKEIAALNTAGASTGESDAE